MPGQNELAIFCAVTETGGFSAAARRLRITKSAVSKAVRKLEDELDARLFHRTTRRISLTEAGELFYAHARRALSETAAAVDAVASLTQEPQGRLRVTAPMSFGLTQLADIVGSFLVRYPRMSVDLHLDDARIDLIAGGFDVAVRIGELADSAMVARPIGQMPAVLVASPDYVAAHGEPRAPAEVARHDCLLFSYAADVNEWQFSRDGHTQRIRVEGRYRVNSSIALRRAVLAGVGVSRIPRYLVADDIAAGRLVQLLADYAMDSSVIHAVFPARGFIPQKARLFADFVKTALAGD